MNKLTYEELGLSDEDVNILKQDIKTLNDTIVQIDELRNQIENLVNTRFSEKCDEAINELDISINYKKTLIQQLKTEAVDDYYNEKELQDSLVHQMYKDAQ